MLESDWLTSILWRAVIFRETQTKVVPGRFWPHYSSISLRQM